MPFLRLIALMVLAIELCACSADPNKQAAIDRMERKHTQWVETMGGGGL